jgi:Flp pilus assembly pilin Flp
MMAVTLSEGACPIVPAVSPVTILIITKGGESEMRNTIKCLFVEEEGISSVEYAILLAFIAVVLVTAVTTLRDQVIASFDAACSELNGGVAC